MRALGGFIFGVVAGVVLVLLAGRSEAGRVALARTDHSLQGFVDGVIEGFRQPGRS
ncbi:hypothetical protein C3B54_111114 [Pontimonas salivibrio]|uniref:Uncharacterized protein n=1 Tax=Pontimonas salivibrio TaxID=1159327 RepID=A0A2L2BQY8_9MICO|nr:hypothetical protein [Pontimonas salivibrio]AVG24079.1 hypothetical protein C3B54_111114 [Pontimonas salivibrio]